MLYCIVHPNQHLKKPTGFLNAQIRNCAVSGALTIALRCLCPQVLTYSLARPAREVLFTVVTREEKYKAKIFIDTVVQVGTAGGTAMDGFSLS